MLVQERSRRSTSPALGGREGGRELTDTSSGLRLPRGTIIPGRSLPNPYFKTSKDGGSLHKPPGDFSFFVVFWAMSCFSYPGKFFLLDNLYICKFGPGKTLILIYPATKFIPKILDAVTKPSDKGSHWQSSSTRSQTHWTQHSVLKSWKMKGFVWI